MNAPLKTKSKKAEFVWQDPLLLDSQLTEQERMVRDAARSYAQDKARAPRPRGLPRREARPGAVREMGELGLFGSTLPAEYGCAGVNYVSYGLIARDSSASIRATARP